MQIAIYAKKRTVKASNKTFYSYLSRLVSKYGEEVAVSVKFPDGCEPEPSECPMNIKFSKADANLSSQKYERADGDIGISHTLWVKRWETGDPFVDTSLDDFE